MTIQLSTTVRNARLDVIESTVGTSAHLEIYSGSMPANCGAATTGTLLVKYDLASDWASGASSGVKQLSSLPLTVTGLANGTAGYFRLFASDDTTCHLQGTVTVTGGGGDMTVDNTSINTGQTVNVTAFALTDGNA